jgi:hypothetical protein
MKNKFISLTGILLLTTAFSYSQVRLGIRGGVNASFLKSDDVITTDDYRIEIPHTAMLGYHVGLISQVQLFRFFLQPEVLYTALRNNIDIYDLKAANPDNANESVQKLSRIDLPILMGYKFKAFKMGVGPVVTFIINENSDLKTITTYDLQLKKATVGYQAGVGLDIGHFAFDLKYEGSLTRLGDGIKIAGDEMKFDSRQNQFIFSIGLFF